MTTTNRLISLDVFRGIVVAAMLLVNFPGNWKAMYGPLEHAAWEGTTPTDFIFPFFIFIVGVSITLSLTRQINGSVPKKSLVSKILIRTLKIFLIGVFIKILPVFNFSRIEIPGVLQRIALVFMACALLFLFTDWKSQLFLGIGILVAYWLALCLVEVPGYGAGVLEPGKNLANWMDGIVFPASLLNKKGYDAEGFLSTFPAIVTGITGLLAGRILLSKNENPQKVNLFLSIGIILVFLGDSWGWFFPVIKKIWTSSFVLLTSGWAFLVFGFLIWLIEIQNFRKGMKPWIIFGSNAIAIYILADVFETFFLRTGIHDRMMELMDGTGMTLQFASLLWALFSLGVCFAASWLLYHKKIFIKL